MTAPQSSESVANDVEQIVDSTVPNGKRLLDNALTCAPRKKRRTSGEEEDPFQHHGRHFGRAICAMANVGLLLANGIERHVGRYKDLPDCEFTASERREMAIFDSLRRLSPDIDEILMSGSTQDIMGMARLIQKGAESARYDDTKSIKSSVVDWIQPKDGPLVKIHRSQKSDRGFINDTTGALLCPAELNWDDPAIRDDLKNNRIIPEADQWPTFLYAGHFFDPEDPWQGLLRGELLLKGYRHVFTSPSSVDGKVQATRSGNARIHGMTQVTPASIVYIATQIRFALMPITQFVRVDTVTGSERFYNSLMNFLDDPDEQSDVSKLLAWWNERIFPHASTTKTTITTNSALAKLVANRQKKKREALTAVTNHPQS